jgi:hypothetical protein
MASRLLANHRSQLTAALAQGGYRAVVQEIPSSGVESGLLRPIRETFKRLLPLPWAYRFSRRIAVRVLPRVLRPLQRRGYVLLAFGEPTTAGAPTLST